MASSQQVPGRTAVSRLVPVTLLVILALAGLRGAVAAPRWDGPLHRYGVQVGVAVELIFAPLLAITLIRMRRQRNADAMAARKLRLALVTVLASGMVAVVAVLIANLHLHLFRATGVHPLPVPQRRPGHPGHLPDQQAGGPVHVNLADVGYGLLVVFLLAATAATVVWSRRHRYSGPGAFGIAEEDQQDAAGLRAAVQSGAAALRAVDDARAAIIACYVAMEGTLADRGAERNLADTPDELLARAVASGLVRGQAASRLTALFYEARFSSHLLGDGKRDAAEQALTGLASELARP